MSSIQSELYLPSSSSEEDSEIEGFSGTLISTGKRKKGKFVSYKPQPMVIDRSSEFVGWGNKILEIQERNKELKEKEEERRERECQRKGEKWFKTLEHVPDSRINRDREDPNNPKFLDEVSPRIKAGIIANIEPDNKTLDMDDRTSEAILNWRAKFLPEQPVNMPCEDKYDYTSSDLTLLHKFNVPGVVGIDLEFTKPEPCVPATIQIYSWDLGCLLLHMEVPRRPDLKIIKEIFQNPDILKIGFGFEGDIKAVKMLGIYPVGMIDIQYIFWKLFRLPNRPSLSNMYEFFTGVRRLSKAERASPFEMRVNGIFPPNERQYAFEDSHMHLRCYFEFLKKTYSDLDADSLIKRKEYLLNQVNYFYSSWMVEQVLALSQSVEPSLEQKKMFKAKDDIFDNEIKVNRHGLSPNQMLMAKNLDKYRESMYLRNGRLSKHDLLPNGLLFDLCKSSPVEKIAIEERIKDWREPLGLKKEFGKIVPIFDGPLHISSSMNGYNMLKILSGEATVEEIVNRVCCRCHERNCFMFSLCEGKRAFTGREVLRRKAEKIKETTGEQPSLNSFYTSNYKRTRNQKDRRRRQRRAAEKLAAEEAAKNERI